MNGRIGNVLMALGGGIMIGSNFHPLAILAGALFGIAAVLDSVRDGR